MIAEGCLEGVSDGVFGFHNLNLLPLGSIWIQPGAASSHCCDIEIVVTGKGGHASMPHVAKDPLLAAASIVTAINTIVSRKWVMCLSCVLVHRFRRVY
jgi:hippurate hydrolase